MRESSATAYLGPEVITQGNEICPDGVGRNILLLSKCTVNKVLFKNKTASKVLFTRNGITQTAKARKEIVLCAGAMTPTILQRSGIGEKCYLQSLGIKSLVNNPHVGAHLKTHNAISFAVEVATPLIKNINKDGIFGQAFLRMGHWHRRLQILPYAFVEGIVPEFVILQGGWQYDPEKPTNLISFFLVDLQPKSEGSVRIKHSDPDSIPEVAFNAYSCPEDLEFGVDAYLVMYAILQEMQKLNPAGIYKPVYPPSKVFEKGREELIKYVRITGVNFYHYASQCRMGSSQENAVVDNELKVFGVENLRVADLCICPIIPDGNTEAAAFMIGRQAARFILDL